MQRIENLEFDEFEWDENKRLSNFQKHDIDFPDAALSLLQAHLESPSNRQGERRTKAICRTSERIVIVIFTMRGKICRIISARRADRNDQRKYRQIFGG
ncbi:MAG: BrnT family toxin [Pseudaminobacter sp.]|nr:BrnT family toxin [Pseudaminobacter sp.]